MAARVVVHVLPAADASGLKTLATAAVAEGSAAVVLLSSSSVVVARSADVAIDANALLRQLTARFGGRGGGKADFAQGGGLTGPLDEIAAASRAAMVTVLNK